MVCKAAGKDHEKPSLFPLQQQSLNKALCRASHPISQDNKQATDLIDQAKAGKQPNIGNSNQRQNRWCEIGHT